jgi:hypothetical protein
MAFPDIHTFSRSHPGPYERNMGEVIGRLLHLFRDHVSDAESADRIAELVATADRWSAGHAVFKVVRGRKLAAVEAKEPRRSRQYNFEEACCQAVYNATDPPDPFDPSAPFFIATSAFRFAEAIQMPLHAVAVIFAPPRP